MKLRDAICLASAIGVLLLVAYCATGQQRRRLSNDEVCKMNLKDLATAIHNFDSELQLSEDQPGLQPPPSGAVTSRVLFQQLSLRELIRPRALICPSDTRLPADNITNVFANNLSYFLSQKLGDSQAKRIIAGDRNIAGTPANEPFGSGVVQWLSAPVMHTNAGWLVLSDTTAFRATNRTGLMEDIARANRANRVIIP